MITITIRECKTNGRTWTSAHRTTDVDLAVRRAISKHWSAKHGFYGDHGLNQGLDRNTTRYGQIGHPVSTGGSTMDTGRVRIDIES